jgi:NitT/TauT family transport system substrate-binding protein
MRKSIFIAVMLCVSIILAACGSSTSATLPSTETTTSEGGTPGASPVAGTPSAASPEATSSGSMSATPAATPDPSPAASTGDPIKVTIATGFKPSMNSAAIYLAAEKGYYKDAGLNVTVKDGSNPDLLAQIGTGGVDFGVSTGDSVVSARAAGVPVQMVMQLFTKYPVGLIYLADSGKTINTPADLKGMNIGVSQLTGSTYYGLLALLQAGHLTTNDVKITAIGFTELEAVSQKRVDAAMTYMSNEPVNAKDVGIDTKALQVNDYVQIVSSGIVASESMIKDHPDVVQKVIDATVKAMNEELQNPDEAFDATIERMPELTADKDKQTQRDILTETLKYQQPVADHPTGWTSPDSWKTTTDFLKSVNVIDKAVDPTTCYTNQFVEQAK